MRSLSYRKSHRLLDLYDLTDMTLMSPFMEKGERSHRYAIGNTVNSEGSYKGVSLAKSKF